MKFASAFTIVALAIAPRASSVANVLTDINKISGDVNTLNSALNAFPSTGGSLTAALAIHSDAVGLVTDINTATSDLNAVTPLPISLADSTTFLNNLNTIKPSIISALNEIVLKKPAFAALPVGGIPALVKADLGNLNAATSAFEAALIAKAPASLQPSFTSIRNAINSAFATAVAAYA